MKLRYSLAAAAMLLPAPASATQYERLANPPDPVAQRDEMIALYDEICLRAFPDDEAAGRAAAGHGGTAMSEAQVRRLLHDDPGIGWRVNGRTGLFEVTIERSPPYHACAVRTMTQNGFADLGPYKALADTYEQGRGFVRISPMDQDIEELHVAGGGEQRTGPGDSGESLLVIITSGGQALRARGLTAIEVRFTHQFIGEPDGQGSGK